MICFNHFSWFCLYNVSISILVRMKKSFNSLNGSPTSMVQLDRRFANWYVSIYYEVHHTHRFSSNIGSGDFLFQPSRRFTQYSVSILSLVLRWICFSVNIGSLYELIYFQFFIWFSDHYVSIHYWVHSFLCFNHLFWFYLFIVSIGVSVHYMFCFNYCSGSTKFLFQLYGRFTHVCVSIISSVLSI